MAGMFAVNSAQSRFVAVPIDLGASADRIFLILFGTGICYRSGLPAITVTIGSVNVPVTYAGAQGSLVGLDQINLGPLPGSLRGRGNVDIVLRVDGKTAK